MLHIKPDLIDVAGENYFLRAGRLGFFHRDERTQIIGGDIIEKSLGFFLKNGANAFFAAWDTGGFGKLFKKV